MAADQDQEVFFFVQGRQHLLCHLIKYKIFGGHTVCNVLYLPPKRFLPRSRMKKAQKRLIKPTKCAFKISEPYVLNPE
jgi:hypothetical protein